MRTERRAVRWIQSAACLLTLACSEPSHPLAPAVDRPSVLLITLDTTRADRLGCYGYDKPISPNLDNLAQRGALFTNAVSQASVTPVSHASILTGLNPYSHGLRVMHGLGQNRLLDEQETLAEVLESAGYRTAAFVSAFPVTERFGMHQGFERFDESFMMVPADELVSSKGTISTGNNQRRADQTTDRALDWLRTQVQPFFLWVHYFDPHDTEILPPGVDPSKLSGSVASVLTQLYDIEIQFMDWQLGRLVHALDQQVGLDNTVVVIVADHGEGLGDHDWWSHGILYEEQIRVPLIILAPGMPAGIRVDPLVRNIDIMPTILDLVGLEHGESARIEGKSLTPLLKGEAADPRYVAYSDSVNTNLTYRHVHKEEIKDDILFSITSPPWKYVQHSLRRHESELYNLVDDPGELRNLIDTHPEERDRLLAELNSRDFAPDASSQRSRMSPEDIERLKSLGYVQ